MARRDFVRMAAAAGVAAGTTPLSFSAGVAADHPSGSTALNADTFRSHVGASLHIHGSETGSFRARLDEVSARAYDPNRPAHVRREPFSLFFAVPRNMAFQDQIAVIHHPKLGRIEAFLSKVGPEAPDTLVLQAVFG